MRRLRQVSPLSLFPLVFLLYCGQTCVAAGHLHAAATATAVPDHSPEHGSCHGSPTPLPQGTPDRCTDCGDHFYLKASVAGAEALTAPPVSLFSCYLLTTAVLPASLQSCAGVSGPESPASSPPRYLTLSVLRL